MSLSMTVNSKLFFRTPTDMTGKADLRREVTEVEWKIEGQQ